MHSADSGFTATWRTNFLNLSVADNVSETVDSPGGLNGGLFTIIAPLVLIGIGLTHIGFIAAIQNRGKPYLHQGQEIPGEPLGKLLDSLRPQRVRSCYRGAAGYAPGSVLFSNKL